MLRRIKIITASVILLIVALIALAHVIFIYKGSIGAKPIPSPITALTGSCPCGCASWSSTNTGFSSTITAYTLSTASGYILSTPLTQLSSSTSATLTMAITTASNVNYAYINDTRIYPGQGNISLKAGLNTLVQELILNTPVTSTLTLNGWYGFSPVTGVTYYYSFTETINPPTSNVMNLLNGKQSWYAPHVYQGDNAGFPTNSWPTYYGPLASPSNYWYYISTSINQPILKMVDSTYGWSSGAMFWQESYSGGVVTITMIGVYSNNGTPIFSWVYPYVGDGYIIYLFLKPTMWGVNSNSNYSIPYAASNIYTTTISPVQGDVMFPQSSSQYLVIEWNPLWQYAYTADGAPGQWDVWVASNPHGPKAHVGPYPSPNLGYPYAGWDGIGSGYFQPNPGNYICITVSYNPNTNTLTGIAYDLNTGQSASFTLSLSNYFTPPLSGTYIFGIAGTNGAGQANWGVVYINYQE